MNNDSLLWVMIFVDESWLCDESWTLLIWVMTLACLYQRVMTMSHDPLLWVMTIHNDSWLSTKLITKASNDFYDWSPLAMWHEPLSWVMTFSDDSCLSALTGAHWTVTCLLRHSGGFTCVLMAALNETCKLIARYTVSSTGSHRTRQPGQIQHIAEVQE